MANNIPFVGAYYSLKSIQEFSKDYLVPVKELFKKYGDRVALSKWPSVILLYHPDDIGYVLKTNSKNYSKSREMKELWPVLGQGLVTSEGEMWKRHRKAVAPEFSQSHMAGYVDVFNKHINQFLDENQQISQIELNPALSQLTYKIAGECFFGVTMGTSAKVIYESIEEVSEFAVHRMARPINIPYAWSLPSHRAIQRTVAKMDEVVFKIINERLSQPENEHKKDVLTRLTKIVGETGQPMFTTKEIRDEVMTLLLAGHETTANALSWTFYLLGRHPEYQEMLRDEVNSVVSGRVPTLEEIFQLKFCRQIFNESLRLFPPIPILGRQSLEVDEINGYHIPKNSRLNLPQIVTHRHPEFWSQPDEFQPERFADESKIHPYSFFPFGGGPRECVGKQMALIEATCVLASLVKSYRMELNSQTVRMKALVTMRPDPGVNMTLSPVQRL